MQYTIHFLQSVKKDLRRIPSVLQERIQTVLLRLAENPFPEGIKKIQGYEHIYRLRVGNYRIVYEVKTTIRIITIMRIAHRKDIYRAI